jgi:hypothetical protein
MFMMICFEAFCGLLKERDLASCSVYWQNPVAAGEIGFGEGFLGGLGNGFVVFWGEGDEAGASAA